MKKSYIVAAVIIIAVLVIGFVVAQQGSDDTQESSTSSSNTSQPSTQDGTDPQPVDDEEAVSDAHVVSYNGSEFSPSTLTVSQGETVTFRNDSSTSVWPASDVHPTHTDLSGFDAQEGIGQGEEYSFMFNQTGEWGYHNHLSPVQTGVIIVE